MSDVKKLAKRKIDRDELILVCNYTPGMLVYNNKSNGRTWIFENFGDTDEIEFSELITMKNGQSRFIKEPWLYILNEDVINYFGLQDLYKKIPIPEDLEKIFDLSVSKLEKALNNMPEIAKEIIVKKAKAMIKSGQLDSVAKVSLIEKLYNVELAG